MSMSADKKERFISLFKEGEIEMILTFYDGLSDEKFKEAKKNFIEETRSNASVVGVILGKLFS